MWEIPIKYSDSEIIQIFIEKNGRFPTEVEWVLSHRSMAGYYKQKKAWSEYFKEKELGGICNENN